METKTVGLASDHAGFKLKQFVKGYLDSKGITYKDYGICGSGEGMAMTLNKHQGIRAGLAWIPEIAHLIRQHNDANVLVMPGRFIDNDTAAKIMDEFFATPFEGGRHLARVKSIPLS